MGWINNQGYQRSRIPMAPDPHPKLSFTYGMDRRSRMPTTPDPYPKLSPTYGMDWRSRMPTVTWSSSKTKSYLWDRLMTKDANWHLILILTGWINNQGCPQAPNPHPYGMDWQPRIPTIKDANGIWSSSKTKSYLYDGLMIKDVDDTWSSSKTKSYLQHGLTIKDDYGHLTLI